MWKFDWRKKKIPGINITHFFKILNKCRQQIWINFCRSSQRFVPQTTISNRVNSFSTFAQKFHIKFWRNQNHSRIKALNFKKVPSNISCCGPWDVFEWIHSCRWAELSENQAKSFGYQVILHFLYYKYSKKAEISRPLYIPLKSLPDWCSCISVHLHKLTSSTLLQFKVL